MATVSVRYMSNLAWIARGEAGIPREYHERLLQQSPSAEETRPDGSHRYAEHGRGLIVCHALDVDQHDGGAEHFRQLADRSVERRTQVDVTQNVCMRADGRHALLLRRERFELRVITAVIHTTAFSFPKPEKNVPADGEEPLSALAARLEGVPGSVCAEKCLLDDVVGVRLVARHGEREAVDIVEPRQCFNLKAFRVDAIWRGGGSNSSHERPRCARTRPREGC